MLGAPRAGGAARTATRAQVAKLVKAIAPLQIDSVNVLVRTQYLPVFSRLGPYRRDIVEELAYARRELVEAWAHEASYIPTEMWPLFAWRRRVHHPRRIEWVKHNKPLLKAILKEVEARGPLAAGDLSMAGKRKGPWWGWSEAKDAMEHLFRDGKVAVAHRRNFERVYDLTERLLPAATLVAIAIVLMRFAFHLCDHFDFSDHAPSRRTRLGDDSNALLLLRFLLRARRIWQ